MNPPGYPKLETSAVSISAPPKYNLNYARNVDFHPNVQLQCSEIYPRLARSSQMRQTHMILAKKAEKLRLKEFFAQTYCLVNRNMSFNLIICNHVLVSTQKN